MRPGFKPTFSKTRSDCFTSSAATMKNPADDMSPGILMVRGWTQMRGWFEPDGCRGKILDGDAHGAQHAFAVVSARGGFVDGRGRIGKESRQQNGGFYLRAGDGQGILDAAQIAPAKHERREPIIVTRQEWLRPFVSGFDDASHGRRFSAGVPSSTERKC